MSQRFLNLIRSGATAEVAAAAQDDPSVVTSTDAQGVSAFLWSIYNQQPLIRDFLLAHLGELDVFEASALGDCARIEALLGKDAQLIHKIAADGWTPLHLAAAFGGASATALLLKHGASVNQISRNPMQNQPLHACIALGKNCETAKILLAGGADVNTAQAGGYTPLHHAAAAGLSEMTAVLLEAGADPALLCMKGKTALDYAQERHHGEVIKQLAERG